MDTLSQRLARGDHAAFAELYDACAERVHHYLWAFLGSKEDAEDVLQETFVRLARKAGRLADVENLTAYVFTIARNEALRIGGRRSRRELSEEKAQYHGLFEQAAQGNSHPVEAVEAAMSALDRLEPPLREVVELKIYAGLTFREIAEVTGAPQGTVASQYQTALEKMRTFLGVVH